MFRPFLPCGIAYGSAYGIPCSFSGGRHPAGLFVLYHIGAVLVNRFRQNFGGICLFPAPGGGCPRVGGDCSGVAGALRGACLVCRLLTLPLVFDFAPYPPSPLPRRGRGRLKVYFAGGFAPGTPALNRLRHLQTLPEQVHDGTTRREPIPVGFAANHGFSPGDARGEAPCIRKL